MVDKYKDYEDSKLFIDEIVKRNDGQCFSAVLVSTNKRNQIVNIDKKEIENIGTSATPLKNNYTTTTI